MYNHLLKTFLCVVDCGSMNKAAERLFLTPTAVMKQMNLLEKQLKLKLIQRTTRGITATRCGQSLYRDAKFIIAYSDEAIERARELQGMESKTIRVGRLCLSLIHIFCQLTEGNIGAYSHCPADIGH